MPKLVTTDTEIERCFDVMWELRGHLKRDGFVGLIRHMMAEGFQMAYHDVDGEIACVSGFRVTTNLFLGKNLYVDDLITSENTRSTGCGRIMMDWLREIAREQGCAAIHLDSGTQRHQAHKFYFRENMTINAYHFTEQLDA